MGELAFLAGATVGAFIVGSILVWVVEKFAFRELPPVQRATNTVMWAGAIIFVIAGFGNANGAGFNWFASLFYIPGLVLLWFSQRRRLQKMWDAEHAETFE